MFKHHALIEHLSVNLHDFIHQISHNLSRPNKKFLRDGLIGLIRAGKPIVCQMARQLPNKRSKYLTRVKRLDVGFSDSLPIFYKSLAAARSRTIWNVPRFGETLAEGSVWSPS